MLAPVVVASIIKNRRLSVSSRYCVGLHSLVHVNGEQKLMSIEPAFYSDKDVASRLNLSASWVRGQRHKRRHGQTHILTVDPRYIGSCPRYVRDEIETFILALAN